MPTIDELGQRAAAAARADAADMAAARVESGLERLRQVDVPLVAARRRDDDPRRWLAIGVGAALAAAAVIAVVVNANASENERLVPAQPSTELSTPELTTPEPTAPVTTNLPESTTGSTVHDTIAPTVRITSDPIVVRHDDLPPGFPATAFATLDAPADPTTLPLVAIGDRWIVSVDRDAPTATLIDPFAPDSPPTRIPLSAGPAGNIAVGPGDVLYGVVQTDSPILNLFAFALSGSRAGQMIASAPISATEFAEAPSGVLGHGPDGIIDRRTGTTLLGYVDVTGAPTPLLGRPAHQVTLTGSDVPEGSASIVVGDPDGTHEWQLSILVGDPSKAAQLNIDPPPAPSSHGGAIVWTSIGPPADPSADIPVPTEPVLAVLAADGTGTWFSLIDGWQVGASDLDGTILVRRTGDRVQLARVDPPQRLDFLDQPAAPHQRVFFAATLPSSLTTADPCTIDNLAVVPEQGGAMGTEYGVVSVRNTGAVPCAVAGVPDIGLLDDAGAVVQSTDPALLARSGAPQVVLEHDSWASALMGPIASNVCGGNQSSQFRWRLGGRTTVLPFIVGGPIDPNGCDPASVQPPVPGALAVEAFAPIQPNDAQPSALGALDVSLDAPSTVRAGDVLHYDVVFTGRATPAVLDATNCPVYAETLGSVTAEFLLNCDSSDGVLVGSGEAVRFHIELRIPADATVGPATLSWTPVEPFGAEVTITVTIVE